MQEIEIDIAGRSADQVLAVAHLAGGVREVVRQILDAGLVLTVEQVSVEPLRMGNYKHVITLRPSRGSNT